MKSITVDEPIYNKIKQLAKEKNTTLVEVMRAEMPKVLESMEQAKYKQTKYNKEHRINTTEELVAEENKKAAQSLQPSEMAVSPRSLIDLVLDLVELDPDAEENKAVVQDRIKALGVKVDNYVCMKGFCESQIERLKTEKDFIERQVKKFENIIETLKNNALFALKEMDIKELKSQSGHKLARRVYQSVDVFNAAIVPDVYKKTVISETVNKTQIKEDIVHGKKDIPGARVVDNEYVNFK